MSRPPIKLAVLASGGGTTLQNLMDKIAAGQLNARIAIVIASRAGIKAIDRAAGAAIPHFIVERKAYPDASSFSKDVFKLIDDARVDLVCLAGWLCMIELPDRYRGRIMNIHPPQQPRVGGKGM
jgi:phosphoribosylglycinamide formyltransferase-1